MSDRDVPIAAMRLLTIAAGLLASSTVTWAEDLPRPKGYLCCNLRTDGSWISDINYREKPTVLKVGTPVEVTGYGRYRAHLLINGEKQDLGNDYSRDLPLDQFAARYVVAEDPAVKLASYPPRIRKAIEDERVMKGMTREQVLMAVGYPVSSENPRLDGKLWRFWLSSFAEFQVKFGDDGRVSDISTDDMTRNVVVQE